MAQKADNGAVYVSIKGPFILQLGFVRAKWRFSLQTL